MTTYCGKDCSACTERQAIGCPGCGVWAPGAWPRSCPIAQCCQSRGHSQCDTCTMQFTCPTLGGKAQAPQVFLQQQQEQAEAQRQLRQRAPFLARWLWPLFWLFLPGIVAGLMTQESVLQWAPGIYQAGQIVTFLYGIAYALILLRLSREDSHYQTAGIFGLIQAALALAGFWGSLFQALAIPLALVSVALSIAAEYNEFTGHSQVLAPVDPEASEKWRRLWHWTLGIELGLLVSALFLVIFPFLGILAMLAASIGLVVVSVLKLVYLYRMAQFFRAAATAAQTAP